MDPELAWERTPGELREFILAYRERREEFAYMLYNHAGLLCQMLHGDWPKPHEAFPGVIQPRERVMSEDEIYAACMAWCGGE